MHHHILIEDPLYGLSIQTVTEICDAVEAGGWGVESGWAAGQAAGAEAAARAAASQAAARQASWQQTGIAHAYLVMVTLRSYTQSYRSVVKQGFLW